MPRVTPQCLLYNFRRIDHLPSTLEASPWIGSLIGAMGNRSI